MRLRRYRLAALFVMLAALGCGCGDDDSDEAGCTAGEALVCSCADGTPGLALCLPSQQASACHCQPARTVPCSTPGVELACSCADGAPGVEICLASGRYTQCACDQTSAGAGAGGNDAGPSAASGDAAGAPQDDATGACPEGFSCVSQMGFEFCADSSGLPPLCTQPSDCAAAGLARGECIDPGLGGVMVCALPCTL